MSESKTEINNPDVTNALKQANEHSSIAMWREAAATIKEAYMNEPARYPSLQVVDLAAEGAGADDTYRNNVIYQVNDSFLNIIGVWKILGVVAILTPEFKLLKEWAYAGFFFVMSGAIFSYVAAGDSVIDAVPASVLLILIAISWYFRRADRKIISVKHQ